MANNIFSNSLCRHQDLLLTLSVGISFHGSCTFISTMSPQCCSVFLCRFGSKCTSPRQVHKVRKMWKQKLEDMSLNRGVCDTLQNDSMYVEFSLLLHRQLVKFSKLKKMTARFSDFTTCLSLMDSLLADGLYLHIYSSEYFLFLGCGPPIDWTWKYY